MLNPVTTLLAWFNKLDHDIQGEIAFLMASQHPSFDFQSLPSDPNELIDYFKKRIEAFSGYEIGNVGFLLSFIAIFDYMIVTKRGNDRGWHESEMVMRSVLANVDPNQPSKMKETAKRWLEELPRRQAQWFDVCESWRVIKDGAISIPVIEKWDDESLAARSRVQV
jgi:hypothetical protein